MARWTLFAVLCVTFVETSSAFGQSVMWRPFELERRVWRSDGSFRPLGAVLPRRKPVQAELWTSAGLMRLHPDEVRLDESPGPRARVEMRFLDLSKRLGPDSRIVLSHEMRPADEEGPNRSTGVSVRVPLGPSSAARSRARLDEATLAAMVEAERGDAAMAEYLEHSLNESLDDQVSPLREAFLTPDGSLPQILPDAGS